MPFVLGAPGTLSINDGVKKDVDFVLVAQRLWWGRRIAPV
jgi:hypothetical protein